MTEPGRGPDAALRAVLVVGLVAAASLALQARHGLDWRELADPVQVRWARVLAGAIVLVLLASTARSLLRRLRRARRRRWSAPGAAAAAPEPVPLSLRILLTLVVLAALGVALMVVDAVSGQQPGDPPPPRDLPSGEGPARELTASWWTLAEVAAVLALAAVVARLVRARRAVGTGVPDPSDGEPTQARKLAVAVEAAEAGLAGSADARGAILAAYAAMAATLTAGLSSRGGAARASDTPTELLERARAAGLVGDGPATLLTELFREARFSRHPMGEEQRGAARAALARVRDELGARRG